MRRFFRKSKSRSQNHLFNSITSLGLSFMMVFAQVAPAYAQSNPGGFQNLRQIEAWEKDFHKSKEDLFRSAITLGAEGYHPLDSFKLLNQEVLQDPQGRPLKKHVFLNRLTIRLINQAGELVRVIRYRDGADITYKYARSDGLGQPDGQPLRMQLASDDIIFHRFNNQVLDLLVHQGRIVYIEAQNPQAAADSLASVSFIDVEHFKVDLGKAEVPVFRYPVPLSSSNMKELSQDSYQARMQSQPQFRYLEARGSELSLLGEGNLYPEAFSELSNLFTVSFNVTASLVDPATNGDAEDISYEFSRYMDEMLSHYQGQGLTGTDQKVGLQSLQALVTEFKDSAAARRSIGSAEARRGEAAAMEPITEEEPLGLSQELLANYHQTLETEAEFQEALLRSAKNNEIARGLIARTSLLMARLTVPHPQGAPRIRSALAHVGAAFEKQNPQRGQDFKQGMGELMRNPYTGQILPAVVVAGTFSGLVFPTETAHYLHQGLDMTRYILDSVLGRAHDFGRLAYSATTATFSGFNPSTLYQAYVADGRLSMTMTGLAAIVGVLYAAIGIPHLIVNSVVLARDLRKNGYSAAAIDAKAEELSQSKPGIFARFRQAFIQRQEHERKEHLRLLAEAELERQQQAGLELQGDLIEGSALSQGPNEQLVEVDTLPHSLDAHADLQALDPQDREEKIEALKVAQAIQKIEAELASKKTWLGKLIDSKLFRAKEKKTDYEIRSFGQALTHFVFGISSFTESAKFYVKFWNGWFAARSLIWRPSSWYTLMAYPNYFGVTINSHTSVDQGPQHHAPSEFNGGMRSLAREAKVKINLKINHQGIEDLRKWERSVLNFEKDIHQAVARRSFRALFEYMRESGDTLQAFHTKPVHKITDRELDQLDSKYRSFYYAYYQLAMKESVAKMLRQVLAKDPNVREQGIVADQMSSSELVALMESKPLLTNLDDIRLEGEELRLFVREAAQAAQIDQLAREQAQSYSAAYHQKLQSKIDPTRNMQMERVAISEMMVKDARSRARAVRDMISSNVIDKPMNLAFIFLLTAGIDVGILQPIQDEMFSEDSWFHLSRMNFLNGFMAGTIMGILSDVWMKLQMDYRLANQKQFDREVSEEDNNRSFLQNYLHEFWHNPTNTWWQHQKYTYKIIWANLPAALVTFIVINAVALGRFDLDAFLVGYALAFLLPLPGFGLKIDQTFELAAAKVDQMIPKDFRTHPLAQKWAEDRKQKLRFKFNLLNSAFGNIVGTLEYNFSLMTHPDYGPRSFARLMFGGYTPTELATFGFRGVDKTLGFIPGVSGLMETCEFLLTNNYTDGVKIPPR